jgi:hypothetical protein
MQRTLLAGFLGALAMFMWMFVAHSLTTIATTGIQEIPNEQNVLPLLTATLGPQPGLYMYPAVGFGPNASMTERHDAMEQYGKKLTTNPSGLLIYKPVGTPGMEPRQLGIEFLTELILSLLAVTLLSQTRITSYFGKVAFISLAGVMACITTNVPYWNWYGFPASYTRAYMFMDVVGYICVGLVAGLVMKNSASMSRSAAA